MQPFTVIKGVSERRRLPRLGKIRLGVKVLAKNGQTYPAEVDYFVVPPEVAKEYGPKPKALDVMFPVQDRGMIFPQALKWYGSGRGLKCIGDGERAERKNEQTGQPEIISCPCPLLEQGQCRQRAHLQVILPKVNYGGVYQIDIGSYHSIVDLNSGLDYVQAFIGRVAMVPLVLTRVPRETFGGGQRRVHYPLQLTLATNDTAWINRLRTETAAILERQATLVLPAPVDENPEYDDGVVVPEAEFQPPADVAEAKPAMDTAYSPVPDTPNVDPGIRQPGDEAQPSPAGRPAQADGQSGNAAVSANHLPVRPPATAPPARQAGNGAVPPRGSSATKPDRPVGPATPSPATAKQIQLLRRLAEERGCWRELEAQVERGLGKAQASKLIEDLLRRPPAQPVGVLSGSEPDPDEESYL